MEHKRTGWQFAKNYSTIQKEIQYLTLMLYIQIYLKYFRGYYKKVNGKVTDNFERSKSDKIRAGNVWVDVQQVFYRMKENVSGCYAQTPLKSINRIIEASSSPGDLVVDFFSHSGTTLISAEKLNRKCFTFDIDPIYTEITIRRLERLRTTGLPGWQNGHPFEQDLETKPSQFSYQTTLL